MFTDEEHLRIMSLGVARTSPISGGSVIMTEVVQCALRDHLLVHVTQEELNSC
jgi:hypothetical protein